MECNSNEILNCLSCKCSQCDNLIDSYCTLLNTDVSYLLDIQKDIIDIQVPKKEIKKEIKQYEKLLFD